MADLSQMSLRARMSTKAIFAPFSLYSTFGHSHAHVATNATFDRPGWEPDISCRQRTGFGVHARAERSASARPTGGAESFRPSQYLDTPKRPPRMGGRQPGIKPGAAPRLRNHEKAAIVTKPATKSAPVNDKPRPAEGRPKHVIEIKRDATKSDARIMAELGLSPVPANLQMIRGFNRGHARSAGEELDATEALAVMREQARAVQAGDLSGLEETLTAQAMALNAIFGEMAWRAAVNMYECIPATEIYLRLGLKAQAQCRATIQTLAEMKNPHPVAFVRQANITNGPQQVNNGVSGPAPARGGITENLATELLEMNHEPRLDTGAAGTAGGAHSELATVGAVLRPQD
jgi:hypothetical protein